MLFASVRLYWEGGAAGEGGSLQGDELHDVGSGGRRCRPGGQPHNLSLWKGMLRLGNWLFSVTCLFWSISLPRPSATPPPAASAPSSARAWSTPTCRPSSTYPATREEEKKPDRIHFEKLKPDMFPGSKVSSVMRVLVKQLFLVGFNQLHGLYVELWIRWVHSGN